MARKYAHSVAQSAAARANLAKARIAQHGRPRTAAQLAAERRNLALAHRHGTTTAQRVAARANLAKARAVERHRPRTAIQLAASRRNLAKARAVESHLPRTVKQIAASRSNLAKARLAKRRIFAYPHAKVHRSPHIKINHQTYPRPRVHHLRLKSRRHA